ncbi:hypothetical protein RhiJN_16650 [Ceratobasidium sp. AG-Ba]|nr:hypothetical protein RhiJN_16650 [Ceratobasidium sp. AG-Ba]
MEKSFIDKVQEDRNCLSPMLSNPSNFPAPYADFSIASAARAAKTNLSTDVQVSHEKHIPTLEEMCGEVDLDFGNIELAADSEPLYSMRTGIEDIPAVGGVGHDMSMTDECYLAQLEDLCKGILLAADQSLTWKKHF